MLYPNNIKKNYNKEISYKNRGMDLEYLIEKANIFYRDNDIAYIFKKPTPIKVVNVEYKNGGKRITDAFYETPSTLDFNGIYKGNYIEFDAKETNNKTSFPLRNVHDHQIKHIKNVYNHKGIVFLIIMMNNKYFLFPGSKFLEFLEKETRQSIPYNYIEENSYELKVTLKGLDYISKLDELIGGK